MNATRRTAPSGGAGTPPRAMDGRAGSCSRWRLWPIRGEWRWSPLYEEVEGCRELEFSPIRVIRWLRWTWARDEPRIGTVTKIVEWNICGLYALRLTGPLGVLRGLLRWRRR